GVRHRTNGRHAVRADVALLARVETDDDHSAITADDLHISARRARDLAALAGLHLDIVDDGADRHLANLHRVAGLHVDLAAGDDLVAGGEALGSDDVCLLAALVGHERDKRRTVRIIFEPLDGRGHTPRPA